MAAVSNGAEINSRIAVSDIAELTVAEIHAMGKEDLIHVIVNGRIPFVDESRLENQDMETLRRLAFLARNCCQNQAV